ncbi:MAG: hypothetical protein JST50_00665, partial [Bacteroidetes bacterium]|nr:hypothetical protein [Bacteroidota bacterium]
MKYLFRISLVLLFAAGMVSCHHKQSGPIDDAAVLHENEDQLTNVIIY